MASDGTNSPAAGDNGPLFPDIDAEDTNQVVEVQSLCMNCHEDGSTKLLLTKIPFFREIIISSFSCEECGHADTSFQSAGKIQEKGVRISAEIGTARDLDRQVVKSDNATFSIPELSFEQPASKKGEISTVEGLIDHVKAGLQQEQPLRKIQHPEVAEQIDAFIEKLDDLKKLDKPFQIVIDDPSGNSFVENPSAPQKDEKMTITHYIRTHQQDVDIGVAADEEESAGDTVEESSVDKETSEEGPEENLRNEVLMFSTNCPSCNAPCETNMKVQEIPFFKEVVIMATVCDICGFRDNEVKPGAGIEDKGTLIKLKITDPSDLNRDVLKLIFTEPCLDVAASAINCILSNLMQDEYGTAKFKSDTCSVRIPELDFELMDGTLGGRFTTIEGLLVNINDQLSTKNPFIAGDSADDAIKGKMQHFCEKMKEIIHGETMDIHFILDDPAGNSYVQNVYAPDPDPELQITHYERTDEHNDLLGLKEMKIDNYAEDKS